ncbi:MAG: OmpA family protein [Deltaproteobacteria bacterium]|nr:OmpA family protein [Deltaproteobacteria bacterium]
MTKRISAAFAVCVLLGWIPAWGAGPAQAQGRAGRVEVGPFVGGYTFDEDLELKNSVVGGARGGYWLSDRFLVEFSLAGVPTKEEDGGDRASLVQGHADLLYHFDLGWIVEPFVAAGLGAARYDVNSKGGKDWGFLLNYGVGARYWINDRIAARVDLRQPITFGSTDYNLMYTVGVSFLLGGAPPAPMAGVLPPRAPTASLTASPSTVQRGESAVLSWTANDATVVTIDGIGAVGAGGSRRVTPRDSTTYRLTARGPGGQVNAATSVSVIAAPTSAPTANLTAAPGTVKWGEPTTLSWTSANATDVAIDGLGAVGTSGSRSVTPNVTTTYRLVAKGPGGMAEATAPVTVELPEKVCISLHIEFDFDKADIKPQYHGEIGKVAEFMKTYPKTAAVIEGHTDNIGTKEYNEKLSLRRADAVVAYLADKYGIQPLRLSSKGYGFSRPVADNATDEGRQKNRRIDAIIDCAVK